MNIAVNNLSLSVKLETIQTLPKDMSLEYRGRTFTCKDILIIEELIFSYQIDDFEVEHCHEVRWIAYERSISPIKELLDYYLDDYLDPCTDSDVKHYDYFSSDDYPF